MRTNGQITRIANEIFANSQEGLNKLVETKKDAVKSLKKADVAQGVAIIQDIVSAVDTILKGAYAEGVALPAHLTKIAYSEEKLDVITVSVRSRLKAATKYRKDTEIVVDDNIVAAVGKALTDSLYEMFYIEQANENIIELNAKIEEICTANEIPFTFGFAVDAESDAYVLSIDNNKVVFNASISAAHSISELGIFKGGDEYNELVAKEATEKLVNSLKAVQSTTQIIKADIAVIKTVTGVSTKKRASKLIRGSYHRNARYLDRFKEGVAYFDETVKIGKEEVEVFALVNKAEDGTVTVVLDPFNVKDNFKVDFDVVKAIKKF